MSEPSPIGAPLKRREDLPLLAGAGRYVDDIKRSSMVHLGVVRSPQIGRAHV